MVVVPVKGLTMGETAKPVPEPRFPDLEGRGAIVTGASRGIGRGIARYLGRQGMRLVLAARSREAGEAVAAEIASTGTTCHWFTADLSTPEGAEALFAEAVARLGRVHLLVANAANLRSRRFLDLDEETYRASFEANVRMVYGIARPVARHMADSGGGSIVAISSVGGLRAHARLAGYDASKGAIDSMTRAMALDLAPHGVRVNAVAPGMIREAGYRRWTERPVGEIPLGRAGTSEEVAAMATFLASDASSYITGQVIYVDGGLTTQLVPPGVRV